MRSIPGECYVDNLKQTLQATVFELRSRVSHGELAPSQAADALAHAQKLEGLLAELEQEDSQIKTIIEKR